MLERTNTQQDTNFMKDLFNNVNIDASFALDWVRENFDPEDIFDVQTLNDWAENNGYKKGE